MIGLDTNVLVRYFAQDDPVQSARAVELIERHLSEDNPGFVSVVAMVETAWVLERSYGLAADELAAIIERLLQAPVLVVENEVEVFTAMTALKEGGGERVGAVGHGRDQHRRQAHDQDLQAVVARGIDELREEGAEEDQRLGIAEGHQDALCEETATRRRGRRPLVAGTARPDHLPAEPDQVGRAREPQPVEP